MLAERNPAERGQLVEWRVTRSCTPEERWSAPYARRSTPPTSAPILVDAQASKAKVIVFAVAGADLLNALKQASEVHLASAHDLTFMQSWYWDLNDQTRAFGKRFFARRQRMPNDNQVALYSSVRHYLEAVARAGTDDTQTVMKGDEGRADP
jgi:ABC-type branched-subunit amino acid transport system substrate-binding protein